MLCYNHTLVCFRALIEADANSFHFEKPVDAIFFADCLFVIPNYTSAIEHAISKLKINGKVVILDFKTSDKRFFRLFNKYLVRMSNLFLGDFERKPWNHLKDTLGNLTMIDLMFGLFNFVV